MFENKVFRKIFAINRDKITRDWRKLHNVKLHVLYSINIIWNLQSRRLRWAGHIAHREQSRNVYSFSGMT